MKLPRQHRSNRAFTLIELLISVVVFSITLSATVMFFSGAIQSFLPQKTAAGTSILPAYSELTNAIQIQVRLYEDLTDAASVFVLGGSEEASINAPVLVDNNIAFSGDTPPGLSAAVAGTAPHLVTSPTQFRAALNLDGLGDTQGHPHDFTLFILGDPNSGYNRGEFISVTTVRRDDSTEPDFSTYEVQYWRNNGSNEMVLEHSYKYALRTAIVDNFNSPVGATHYWLRQNMPWSIHEHFAVQMVFPDPTAYPYDVTMEAPEGGGDDIVPQTTFSRLRLTVETQRG
jgi:prepilin-type N-terminal cleavage/methylation domain-containing protein